MNSDVTPALFVAHLAVALIVATSAGDRPDRSWEVSPDHPAQAEIVQRNVDPTATGAGISRLTGQHFVVVPRDSGRTGKLLVFLPGTGGRPDFYKSFLRHAAERGNHAVALAYENAIAVNRICATRRTATCQEEVRTEVITGAPRSTLVSVDSTNSIDNRLRALLVSLDRQFPREGWSAFLASGVPRWDRIMVAGHSQGGGHAAMIARLRRVDRAILFSATEPAPWTSASFATPKERLFGFVHTREEGYNGITRSWRSMGFVGSLTSVDSLKPPYGGAHQLQTSVESCRPFSPLERYHNCGITDALTPLTADRRPAFAAVWTYLLEGVSAARY